MAVGCVAGDGCDCQLSGSHHAVESNKRRRGLNDLTNRHFQSWAAEVSARSDSLHDFLRFFDDADNPEQSWMSGFWDFAYHILKPKGISLLGAPFEKTALEIGYGGGAVATRRMSLLPTSDWS